MPFMLSLNQSLFRQSGDQRRRLYLKLGKLLANRVPLLDALKSIKDRRGPSSQDPMGLALEDWISHLNNGRRLSQAISDWVPNDERMLIDAGEQAGKLDETLEQVCVSIISKKNIRSALLSGLTYPLILALMAIGVLLLFSYKIIPEFGKIVPDEKWTGVGRVMIRIADFTQSWIIWILAAGLLLVIVFFMLLPRWSDGLRSRLDRYIPFSVYRMLHGTTWMISLAALVNSGVRVENALIQLAESGSPWLKARTQSCLRGMRSGLTLGDSLNRSSYQFPDKEIIEDLCIYSQLSGVDEALSILAKEWMEEGVKKIQALMRMVFSVSVCVVGFVVVFMVSGLISMQLQMATLVQQAYR